MATWNTLASAPTADMRLAFAFVDNPIDQIDVDLISGGASAVVTNNTTFNGGNGGVLEVEYTIGGELFSEAGDEPTGGSYAMLTVTRGANLVGTLKGVSPFAAFTDIVNNNAWKVLDGDDVLNGADGVADILTGGYGGSDSFDGQGGSDIFMVAARSGAPTHTFTGGTGTDRVEVSANIFNAGLKALDLRGATFVSIDALTVDAGLTAHLNAAQINAALLAPGAALSGGGTVHIHLTSAQTLDLSAMSSAGVTVIIEGSVGVDTLLGTPGVDRIVGRGGKDTMAGSPGDDVFDFDLVTDSGKKKSLRDVITDFAAGFDKIDLSTIDANGSKGGDQAFKFIKKKAFHDKAGELRFAKINKADDAKDVTLVEGDVNGNGKADFRIELTGLVNLDKGDFVL